MLLWRKLERQTLQHQIIAGFAHVMGAEGVTVPDVFEVQARFNELLASPPSKARSVEDQELIEALGIGR